LRKVNQLIKPTMPKVLSRNGSVISTIKGILNPLLSQLILAPVATALAVVVGRIGVVIGFLRKT
jgi:hypothetical protein